MQNDENSSSVVLLRKSIDESISSLGGPIARTINWHMDNRGVFSDPKKLDIDNFSKNLEELVGPGAELILEETADRFEKNARLSVKTERNVSPAKRILRIIELIGGKTEA